MHPPASPETIAALGSDAGRLTRAFRQLKSAPCTWQLVRVLLIIQAAPVIWDLIDPSAGKLSLAQEFLGLTQVRLFSGKVWQPFTYAVIHVNWAHLLANVACIILLGPKLEHIVLKRSFWLLCLYSALAGGLFFLLLTPVPTPGELPPTLVGASSVCFAFLVFLTTLSPGSRFLPLFLSGRTIGIAIILTNLLLALLNPDLPTAPLAEFGKQLTENGFEELFKVSHACHLGGSLVGFFYGKWLLRPRVTLKSLQQTRAKKEAKEMSRS